jgi:hypothetical protein
MKRTFDIPKKSRRHIFQNFFVSTKTYFRNLSEAKFVGKKDYQIFFDVLLWLFLPVCIFVLPVVDIFLLFFTPGLHLFRPLFKAGWKYALISAIGVTLAVSVITQYVFFIYSYQFQAFDLYLEAEPRRFIQVELENIPIEPSYHQYNSLDNVARFAIEYIDLSHRVPQRDLYFKFPTFTQSYDPIANETTLPNMPLYGSDIKLRYFVENNIQYGEVADTDNEAIALMTRDFYEHTTIRNGSVISIYVPISLSKEDSLYVPSAQTVVNVTGIVILDEIPIYNVVESSLGISLEHLLGLEDNAALFSRWIPAATILNSIAVTYGQGTAYENLFYDISQIDAFQIDTEITILKTIGIELKEWYQTLGGINNARINSYLVDLMESFKDEYGLYQTFMFSFLAPIMALTIILTVYAANLVRKKRDRQLTILTERGSNRREIGSYLALESLIVGGAALLAGIFIGTPIASLLTRSSGFLKFSNTSSPLQIELSSVIVAIIGSVGAILLIQLFNTATLLRKRNIEDYGKVEKSLPRFYKYFIDIIFIIMAVTVWIVYQLPVISAYKEDTARYIGIPGTILMIFGVILLCQRFLPLFARLLIKVTSKLKMDISSLSVREIDRYQKSFARSSIILSLSFSLVVASIVVPFTYQQFNINSAYYDLGSDIMIRAFPDDNLALKESIENITEVESTSIGYLVNLDNVQGDLALTYSVFIVDPVSYNKTAYFRDDFSKSEFIYLMNALNESNFENPLSVHAQEDELAAYDIPTWEDKPITYRAYNESMRPILGTPYWDENITIRIMDTFKYWPVLVNEIITTNVRSQVFHFVAPTNFLNHVQLAPFELITFLFIKVTEGAVISDVADEISRLGFAFVYDLDREVFVRPDSPRSSILYSAINSTLLMAFTINAIILALFASIQLIDKSKEIATMKAIGISSRQLLKYYLSVYISLLVFTTIVGLIVGYVASSMLMAILAINRTIPPYSMAFPGGQIVLVLSILFVTALVGAAIPTVSSSRQEIGTELRQSA